jgi:hypothetical protein
MTWESARHPMAPLALLLATLSAGAGCQEDRGRTYQCRCQFLTDYDDPSMQAVEICAATAHEAPAVAQGCAQSAAPAPIQSCSCEPAAASAPCSKGACRAK